MITNVNFDDIAYSNSISSMIQANDLFQVSVINTRAELMLFQECVKNFSVIETLFTNTLTNFITMGDIAKTSVIGLSSAFSTFEKLGKGIEALDKLTYGFASITPLMNATGIAMGMEMTATNLLAAAQTLLNGAMMLFPAAAVIAGIAVISAAIFTLAKDIANGSKEFEAFNARMEEAKKKTDELNASMKESETAYKGSTEKIEAQTGAAEKLAEKVFALAEADNKSAEEKRQLAVLVDELNSAMPDLNLVYDEQVDSINGINLANGEQIGMLSRLSEEVYSLIDAKKEEFLQQAASERALELAKEMFDIEMQLKELQIEKNGLTAQFTEGSKEYINAMASITERENELKDMHKVTGESFDLVTESIVESAERERTAREETTDGIIAKYEEQQEAAKVTAQQEIAAAEEAANREAEILKEREEKLQSYTDTATNMFSSIKTESETSVTDLIANLENNQQALKDWSGGIETLTSRFQTLSSDGINAGLLAALQKAGPESAGIINNLVNASDDELTRLNEVFSEGASVATEALMTELGLPEFVNAGSDAIDIMSDNIKNNGNLEKETVALIQATLTAAEAEIKSGGFVKVGLQIAEGLAQGVRDGIETVRQAIKEMADTATVTAQVSLVVNSPSRLFRDKIGLMVALGFAAGIEDGIDNVAASVRKMSGKAVGALDSSLINAINRLPDKIVGMVPAFATGQIVPAHEPYAGVISSSINNVLSNTANKTTTFTQNIQLTSNDMSDAEKIRLLQRQSRQMLRLGV